jgi:ElaB/YqjD/DUF883 family membrane-anchored ribosome-binding protein
MADEIRVVPEGMDADDPEITRAQIADTRARMSGTIDEIEDALLRRKEQIQHRLDPFSPVRDRPFQAVGAVFGAGLVLGLLTGGDDDDDDDYDVGEFDYDVDVDLDFDLEGSASLAAAEARADRWEQRARRLLLLAREAQHGVRDKASSYREHDEEEWDDDGDDGDLMGIFGGLRDAVADRVAPLVGGVIRRVVNGNRHS